MVKIVSNREVQASKYPPPFMNNQSPVLPQLNWHFTVIICVLFPSCCPVVRYGLFEHFAALPRWPLRGLTDLKGLKYHETVDLHHSCYKQETQLSQIASPLTLE